MLHHDPAGVKPKLFDALASLAKAPSLDTQAALQQLFEPGALYFANHPFNDLVGPQAVAEKIWVPLKESFRHLRRSDDMFIGGNFGGADWISATGHLHGAFMQDFLGIPATGNWAHLRY